MKIKKRIVSATKIMLVGLIVIAMVLDVPLFAYAAAVQAPQGLAIEDNLQLEEYSPEVVVDDDNDHWDDNSDADWDDYFDGPIGPAIGHLEARLTELEEMQHDLLAQLRYADIALESSLLHNIEINEDLPEDEQFALFYIAESRLETYQENRGGIAEELDAIATEIRSINEDISDAWEAFLANDPYALCGEEDCDCENEDDEPETGEEEEYYLNEDFFYIPEVQPDPDFVLPARLTDEDIAALYAEISAASIPVHPINNPADLRAFLNGTLGENYHHFVLGQDIIFNEVTQGRPGVFTGEFDGNDHTITGLRLRPTNEAHRGIGLVREAGDGAVIRNVTFHNTGTTDATRSFNDPLRNSSTGTPANTIGLVWRSTQSGIGMVVGRTSSASAAGTSVIIIENVHLTGTHQMQIVEATGTAPPAGQRGHSSNHVAAVASGTHQNSRIGGMVGQVDANTTLIMRDVTVGNIIFNAGVSDAVNGNWGSIIAAAGGLVGAVNGGILDIRTGNNTDINRNDANGGNSNRVNAIEFRNGGGRGIGGAAGSDEVQTVRGVSFGGGVLGWVYSGSVFIEDVAVGTRSNGSEPSPSIYNPLGHMDAINVAGGIVGGGHVGTNIRLEDVHNLSVTVGVRARGIMSGTTPRGRSGGLVGHAGGTLTIVRSSNNAAVRNSNSHTASTSFIGGLLGYAAPTSAVVITESYQGANAFFIHHRNLQGGVQHNAGATSMGGIIGAARGFVTITNTNNYGPVLKSRVGTAAHGNNTFIGGIVGRAQPVVGGRLLLENVHNYGNVTIGGTGTTGGTFDQGRGSAGGIVGEILPTVGGNAPVILRDVVNRGTITGGRQNGGIAGWSRANNVRFYSPVNHGTLITRHAGSTSGAGGAIPDSGGIVGRISGSGTTINNPTNYGNVTPAGDRGSGTGGTQGHVGGIGGIVGRSQGIRVTITGATNYGVIAAAQASGSGTRSNTPRNAGGIVGIITHSNVTISNSVNRGAITTTGVAANSAGGIVGRIGASAGGNNAAVGLGNTLRARHAANVTITNVQNYGPVRATARAGGIVGFAQGNDTIIERAMNFGNVDSTLAGLSVHSAAGGIVGFNNRPRLTIRNSGNVGTITSPPGGPTLTHQRNMNAGTGGILGRTQRANTRVEVSFNQGAISGTVATGGIIGRNEASLIIQDVYNIGPVHGSVAGSGSGIVGRRRSGTITINRAWVAADVRGYAVGVTGGSRSVPEQRAGNRAARADVRGFRFSQVYVDSSTTVPNTDFNWGNNGGNAPFSNANRPATQHDRPGITLVDTELLTLGLLPGIRDGQGPWVNGLIDENGEVIDFEEIRTYPYFNWQVPGYRQEQFFDSITAISIDPDHLPNTPLNVMDLYNWENPITLRNVGEPDGSVYFPYTTTRGVRLFNAYRGSNAGAFPFAPLGESTLTLAGRDGAFSANTPTSIGLISSNSVVAWSPREVLGRLIFTAYDCISGTDVTHAQFSLTSGGEPNYPIFFNQSVDFTVDPSVVVETHEFDGFAIIMFHIYEGVISYLNPRNTGATPGVTVQDLAEAFLQYTTVGVVANPGYHPAWRTVTTGDFDAYTGSGHIRIPMIRKPFELHVWVRDYWLSETEIGAEDPNNHPTNADSEIWDSDHIPGQALADAQLNHVRPDASCDYPWSATLPLVERPFMPNIDGADVPDSWTLRGATGTTLNQITYTNPRRHIPGERYFRVPDAMFGDTFIGTGTGPASVAAAHGTFTNNTRYLIPTTTRIRTIETVENLRFEDLRECLVVEGRWHLDIYVDPVEVLPPIHFQFVDAQYPNVLPLSNLLNIENIDFNITSWGSSVDPVVTRRVPTTGTPTQYEVINLTLDSTFDVRWLIDDPDFMDQVGIHTIDDFIFFDEIDSDADTAVEPTPFTITQGIITDPDNEFYGEFTEIIHRTPLIIRIPLIRRDEHIVYVVTRLDDGTYLPVEGATVTRGDIPLTLLPGAEASTLFDYNRFTVPYLHTLNVFEVSAPEGFGASVHVIPSLMFERDEAGNPIPVRIVVTRLRPRDVTFMYNRTPSDTDIFKEILVNYNMPIPEPTDNPERENYVFGGWLADRNNPESLWDFTTSITVDMNLYALWIPEFAITINNVPAHPVSGEAIVIPGQTQGGPTSVGQSINLNSGNRTADDLYFLGWWIGTVSVPAIGVHIDTISGDANFMAPATTTFTMPARNETLTALWGNEGVIGGRPYYVVFHLYTDRDYVRDQFSDLVTGETSDGIPYIQFPVWPGAPLSQDVQDFVSSVVGIYGANTPGHAFWGWFTDATLDASERVLASGFRRPWQGDICDWSYGATHGSQGFAAIIQNENITTTQREIIFGSDGILNLYAVWARWGDVNDDDRVCDLDLTLLIDYLVNRIGPTQLNMRAANVVVDERVCDVDLARLIEYLVNRIPQNFLGRPPEPTQYIEPYTGFSVLPQGRVGLTAFASIAAVSNSNEFRFDVEDVEVAYGSEYAYVRISMTEFVDGGFGSLRFDLEYDPSVLTLDTEPRLIPSQTFLNYPITMYLPGYTDQPAFVGINTRYVTVPMLSNMMWQYTTQVGRYFTNWREFNFTQPLIASEEVAVRAIAPTTFETTMGGIWGGRGSGYARIAFYRLATAQMADFYAEEFYVELRFRVAPDAPVGSYSEIRFIPVQATPLHLESPQFSQEEVGSVRIIGEDGSQDATSFSVSYSVQGDAPEYFAPAIPVSGQYAYGENVEVASGLTTEENTHNEMLGMWRFDGWFKNGELVAGSFTMPNADVVLEGRWTFIEAEIFDITFVVGEGGEAEGTTVIQVQYGGAIPMYDIPSIEAQEGWVFVEWTPSLPTGSTIVTEEMEFTANFAQLVEANYYVRYFIYEVVDGEEVGRHLQTVQLTATEISDILGRYKDEGDSGPSVQGEVEATEPEEEYTYPTEPDYDVTTEPTEPEDEEITEPTDPEEELPTDPTEPSDEAESDTSDSYEPEDAGLASVGLLQVGLMGYLGLHLSDFVDFDDEFIAWQMQDNMPSFTAAELLEALLISGKIADAEVIHNITFVAPEGEIHFAPPLNRALQYKAIDLRFEPNQENPSDTEEDPIEDDCSTCEEEPTDPEEPTNATEPTESTEPAAQTQPAEATEPAASTQPTQPAQQPVPQAEASAMESRPELIIQPSDNDDIEPYEERFRGHFVQGYADGTFRPEGNMTRAEMIQVFFNIANVSPQALTVASESRFTDVSSDAWYFEAVVYFEDRGIIQGFPDGTLRPSETITNAEFAALAVQFFSLDDTIEPDMLMEASSHWGANYINLGFARGWFEYFGVEETFDPDAPIQRAQAVALLNFYQGRIPCTTAINALLTNTNVSIFPDLTPGHWSFYEVIEAAFSRYYHIDGYSNEVWLYVIH